MPDPPIDLINDDLTTSDTVIRFTWSEGVNNGGTAVIDYAVYFDQGLGTNSFVLLASGVTEKAYVTTVALTSGTFYQFKVKARNVVGSSEFSLALTVIAAKSPD